MESLTYHPHSENPYCEKLRQAHVLANDDTEQWASRWREKLGAPNNTPLHVEIGCNAGHVIRAWAALDKHSLFIGVDWKYKQVFRGHEKGQIAGLTNLAFLRTKAERFAHVFGLEELTSLSVFFPDPWPKKRHHKHRYLTAPWIDAAWDRIAPGGMLHIKTDHREYFDQIVAAAAQTRWQVEHLSYNLHEHHPDPRSLQIPDVTLFEKLFIADGLPVHSLKLRK